MDDEELNGVEEWTKARKTTFSFFIFKSTGLCVTGAHRTTVCNFGIGYLPGFYILQIIIIIPLIILNYKYKGKRIQEGVHDVSLDCIYTFDLFELYTKVKKRT